MFKAKVKQDEIESLKTLGRAQSLVAGEVDDGIKNIKRAIAIAKEKNIIVQMARGFFALGEVLIANNKPQQALKHLERAKKIFAEFNAKFHLIEKPLLQYRIHSEQLSHKKISQTLSFLTEVQSQILSLVDDSTKEKYQNALLEYEKKKPLQRKTMELGLKIAKGTFPDWVTDWLLVFYLNKIRSSR